MGEPWLSQFGSDAAQHEPAVSHGGLIHGYTLKLILILYLS